MTTQFSQLTEALHQNKRGNNMTTSGNHALAAADQTAIDTKLLPVLHQLILEFLLEGIVNHYQSNPKLKVLFIANILAAYPTHISYCLLWNIKVDETLELATRYPQSLKVEVEIKDPDKQRMRGTTLKILAMAGDRNPRELK